MTTLHFRSPRPSWEAQDDATKALWNAFARRLLALYQAV